MTEKTSGDDRRQAGDTGETTDTVVRQSDSTGGTDTAETSAPATGRRRSYRTVKIVASVAGILGFLMAVLTPFMPVKQTTAELNWPQSGQVSSVTAPLVSFVPIDMTATVPCSLARELPRSGGNLFSTVPTSGEDASARGMFIRVSEQTLTVTIRDVVVLTAPRAAAEASPDCSIVVNADGKRVSGRIEGLADTTSAPAGAAAPQTTFGVNDPNLRPQIVGFYTDLPKTASSAGLSVHATIDTRYVTTPTVIKRIVIVVGILLTLISLVALGILDMRDGRGHRRWLPAGWWRVHPVDVVVFVILAVWWLIGANTSDDGYNFTVARVAGTAGYLDNYYRYFGVPQDPFGWHYYVLSAMTHVSLAAPWMRLPAFLLGLLGWWLISREAIPRLGRTVRTSQAAIWSGATVFLAVWLPLNNGLRPEPVLAVGALLTWCCVERSIATGRLLPLAIGTLTAAFTLAVAPGGLMAVAALLAGIRPLLKRVMMRRKRDGLIPLLAPILAAGTAVLFEIFADDTFGSVLTANQVASQVGPTLEWWQEPVRYYYLMLNTVDGGLSRRFAVLVMILCLLAVILVMLRRRMPTGIAKGPVWRIVATVLGTMFFTAFTPTKWTHHFGVYACIAGVLGAAAGAMMAPVILRRRRNRTFFAAAVLFVAGLAFSATNGWWFVGSFGVPWWDRAPQLAGINVGWAILAVAAVVALVGLWQHFRDDYTDEQTREGKTSRFGRLHVTPLPLIAGLVVLFEVASLAKGAYVQRDSFSWASSNIKALRGDICSMADDVLVEPDPNVGLLRPARLPGQENVSPGDALAGKGMTGFDPNGVPTDLSVDSTVSSDSDTATSTSTGGNSTSGNTTGNTTSGTNSAGNSAGSQDTDTNSESASAGTTGGQGQRGVNGSTAKLPFGLKPSQTPVLGSYGTGGGAKLTSDWYDLPQRSDDRPLLTMSVAGTVAAYNFQGVLTGGSKVVVQFGRTEADGTVRPLGTMSPTDALTAPQWRNLRFPMDKAPAGANVVRVIAADPTASDDQWVAITPPRVTQMRTLDEVVGRKDPVLIDWLPAFVFPCQQPMLVKNGVAQVPKWRILPDANATKVNSQTWMSGKAGGPLGLTDAMLTPTLLPSYMKNDWARDWGNLQRFTEIDPAPPAKLELGTATRSGTWSPAPMRSVGY
ncbi:arabinosyltransferase domain-containing protein [Gordonia jinhuaensis]|uniref:Arabinosyl transferase n=2 Tax=Gordonia jinhuaensis TaxID=1517702 RepID=A0A916T854_9ACTN|nr:arabinosyl transferase [Gordonia jinhuaensis]